MTFVLLCVIFRWHYEIHKIVLSANGRSQRLAKMHFTLRYSTFVNLLLNKVENYFSNCRNFGNFRDNKMQTNPFKLPQRLTSNNTI